MIVEMNKYDDDDDHNDASVAVIKGNLCYWVCWHALAATRDVLIYGVFSQVRFEVLHRPCNSKILQHLRIVYLLARQS